MHPQLAAVVADLESAAARVRWLHASLSCRAWSARPAPGGWSAAECVAHLNLTSDALIPLLRDALRHARDRRDRQEPRPSRYRRDALGWLAWKLIAPDGALKTRTIATFVPTTAPPVEGVLNDFVRLQATIVSCVREADGLPLERVKVRSPFDGRMVYNAYAALTLVPRHQHRHLRQAERAAQAYALRATMAAVPRPRFTGRENEATGPDSRSRPL